MTTLVWRGGEEGAFERFEVPRQASQTVLDVVVWIQRNADATLAYRYACRVGMCGSCAMMVNGRPRWTCRTHVDKVGEGGLEIAPLRNLPVIRDLAVDMAPFFEKWQAADGVFAPTKTRDEPVAPVQPAGAARLAAAAGIECINCAVCHAACDVVAANADYLGPAALNRAWTLQNDVRDGARSARLAAVTQDGGCQNCHAQQGCTAHCPNELNPTASIAGLKRMAVRKSLGLGG
ncbi:MAG: 2Fe-2S iron-sulfur cluster-binding protein [Alphaproteobacteria bacterium]|nr:2Fe-2S iron-sulfur cluster-binding protein [Alphaproteobacteria bacterium]